MQTPLPPATRRAPGFTLIELLVTVAVVAILATLGLIAAKSVTTNAKKAQSISNLRSISAGMSTFLAENNNRYPGEGGGNGARMRWLHRLAPYMGYSPIVLRTDLSGAEGESIPTYWDAFYLPIFHSPMTAKGAYSRDRPMNGIGVYGYNPRLMLKNGDLTGNRAWGESAASVRLPSRTVMFAERYSGLDGSSNNYFSIEDPYPKNPNGVAANYREDGNPSADPNGAGPGLFLFCDGHVESINLETIRPWPSQETAGDVRFYP